MSFGTAGCNLGCRFCQNWDISESRELDILADAASPEDIALAAQRQGCASVAFTQRPGDLHGVRDGRADACRARGIRPVAGLLGVVVDHPQVAQQTMLQRKLRDRLERQPVG